MARWMGSPFCEGCSSGLFQERILDGKRASGHEEHVSQCSGLMSFALQLSSPTVLVKGPL